MVAPPPPTKSQLAALYQSEHGGSLADAAKLYGVTRQAASQAAKRLRAGTPRGKPGRRPRSADGPATEDVRVRLHHGYVTLHLTEDERAQLRGAAGEVDFAEWCRKVIGKRRIGGAAVRDLLLAKAVE